MALAGAEDADLVSAGPRFLCATAAERLLHPAMAATLVYRFGPSDVPGHAAAPSRAIVNGQCLLVRRGAFAACGRVGARARAT